MIKIDVIESSEKSDLIKMTADKEDSFDNIRVVSGEIVEQSDRSLTLRLKTNDAISVGGEIYLWWDRGKKVFVRQ